MADRLARAAVATGARPRAAVRICPTCREIAQAGSAIAERAITAAFVTAGSIVRAATISCTDVFRLATALRAIGAGTGPARVAADVCNSGVPERILTTAIAADLPVATGSATRAAMVRIVQQRDPVDAKALAADLIRFADDAVATAVAVVALEVIGGRLAPGAADKLICRAPAESVDTHARAAAAGRLLVALLTGDCARSIADHPLSVKSVSTWTGADPIDARRAHLGTAVEVGPARLSRAAADQSGDLHADAIPAVEAVAARRLRSAWKPIACTRPSVRYAITCIIELSTRAIADPVEARVTGTTGIRKLAWGAGRKAWRTYRSAGAVRVE